MTGGNESHIRIALICNPQSGRGVDAEGTADKLRRLGADIVEVAHSPGEATGSGAERVVVVGGDGTLAPAAELAGRLGVPLAVIPAGTANDFARALEIPLDLDAAIDLAVHGERQRTLELARLDDRPFLNVASSGLSPAAARRAEPFKRLLGPLAYPAGALLAGARERPIACRALVDGQEAFDGRAWQLTVASTGAFGGGAEIDAADPHDGRLDLLVIAAGRRLALPRIALDMRRGSLAESAGVTHVRGNEIVVQLPPGTPFNVDGEVIEAPAETRFTARSRAFSLIER